jgi:hypothetical protein
LFRLILRLPIHSLVLVLLRGSGEHPLQNVRHCGQLIVPLRGGALGESIEGLSDLYRAIGAIVTLWSMIEQSLDACVALIYHSPGGAALHTGLPRNTKRKAELVKDGLKKLPHLAPYRDPGLALVQRVMDTKDDRHSLVHSVLTSLQPVDGVYSYIGLKPTGEFHVVTPWRFDLNQFPATERKLWGLAIDLQQFWKSLLEETKGRIGPPPPFASPESRSPRPTKRKAP